MYGSIFMTALVIFLFTVLVAWIDWSMNDDGHRSSEWVSICGGFVVVVSVVVMFVSAIGAIWS